jgi:hypothetical protein
MATLVSPGIDVTVSDESIYAPASTGTVPYVLIATGQDKSDAAGTGTAAGTTAATANDIYLISSRRELTATFGAPTFYQSTSGTGLHGYELNEYGLMAAYSLLGISNRCYVQRVDIDLSELTGASRPTGNPVNGTVWIDASTTSWGITQFSAATQAFGTVTPIVIEDTADLTGGVPLASIGDIGDYAVVATNTSNPTYYKNRSNAWVLTGDTTWEVSWPAASSTASPTFAGNETIVINTITTTLSSDTTASLASSRINTAMTGTGITTAVVDNVLEFYVESTATSDGSTVDGKMVIADGGVTGFLAAAGITAGTYAGPLVQQSPHYTVPEWKSGDTVPRPTGSVWVKTTKASSGGAGNGAHVDLSVYNSTTDLFVDTTALLYENDQTANKNLDSSGGGQNLSTSTYYMQYDVTEDETVTYKLFKRYASGDTIVVGNTTTPAPTTSDTFTISASAAGSVAMSTPVTVTMSGTTGATFVTDILAANVTGVTAAVETTGAVSITHTGGGVIVLKETLNTPLADVGLVAAITTGQVRAGNASDIILSNWVPATYTTSVAQPTTDPSADTYWFHDDVDDVDIMIHDGSVWRGYQNVSNDARGYDLSTTDPAGPQVAAAAPTTQSDETALVYGDLWVDTSDLENYPILNRWQAVSGEDKWVVVDNTDQGSENGILFADARFMGDTTTDVNTGTLTSIVDLLTSDIVDLDEPDPAIYPRGMLLWNTRRSGYTVKKFKSDYFNRTDFPIADYPTLPTETNAWVTVSGNKLDGSPYMGRKAQRAVVVAAFKAGIDASTDNREETREFNIISSPGYPELIPNMIQLNTDRRETAFVVGDTPMRLGSTSTEIQAWATNATAGTGEDGLANSSSYMGLWYCHGLTNDLSGNTIVVPSSHMVLRGLVRNDDVAFPWFAPAGPRRGLVDNASAIGYLDAASGEFQLTDIRESVRDTLYTNDINPITNIPGIGVMLYGNLTVQSFASALDRINVARLVAHIRRQLDKLAKPFIFEPNDKLTRDEIKQVVEQEMNDLVAKRGLYDYLVVCDESNNTSARIDRNELYVDIAIEPVKTVEFIYIPLRILNTGEIAGG